MLYGADVVIGAMAKRQVSRDVILETERTETKIVRLSLGSGSKSVFNKVFSEPRP